MRCPYCGTENDESTDRCRRCGEELSPTRAQWKGPAAEPQTRSPQQISSAFNEWDPAKRFSEPRPASAFVPPARYSDHMSWIVSILCVGIPATAIHAVLFLRHVEYPHNLGVAVWVVLLCCVPLSFVSLILAGLVRASHRLGKDPIAYRLSRTIGLLCWISVIAALALYVILFFRLISNVGDFWVY